MIVVTGGAGFIGSALVWKLNTQGEENILIVDQRTKGSPKARNLEKLRYKKYLESDVFIKDLEEGRLNGQLKAIFHIGACSSTTETNQTYLKENNSQYSERLAAWAIQENIYFSYASSAATYGAGELSYTDGDQLTPQLKPLNPYGQSKLDFDIWVLKKGLDKKISGFRFFNVYGPNEYHKKDMRSMIHKGFEQIQKTNRLRLFKSYKSEYADGEQKRDFIYVKDVVNTVLWFWKHSNHTGIFNLGSGQARTWNDLAKALFKACGKPVQIDYIEVPDNIKDQYQYLTEADLTKLKKTGCPTRFVSIEEGINDYVKNYLLNQSPYL